MTPTARALATALLPALVLLASGACSREDTDRDDRDGPEPASTSTTSASTPAEPAVAFGFGGARPGAGGTEGTTSIRIGCTPYDSYLFYEQLAVDAPVTLRSLTSDGLEVGRSWISDDREQRFSSGTYAVDAPGGSVADEPGWADRRGLAGARLEPGRTYTFFAEVELPVGSAQREFRFDYLVGDRSASVSWPYAVARARRCS